MSQNGFLKACWKDNIERDYSEKSLRATLPEDIRIIRELTEINAPPEEILLMVMATIYKGVCAKILHKELVECLNEKDPDRTDKERVIVIRCICDQPIKPVTKLLVIMNLVTPGAYKKFKAAYRAHTKEEMTPPLDTMTPSQEPSQTKRAVIAGRMTQ